MKRLFITAIAFTIFMIVGPELASAQKIKPKPAPKAKVTAPIKPASVKPVSVKCDTNGLTPAEITELLSSQNKVRAELKLPPFVWDCRLANYAQEWANKGKFDHRENNIYGENLFVSSSPAEPIETVIKTWMSEKPNWTNKTATCVPGKTCTHYTQVVWNTTTQVGCGVNRNTPGQWKTLLVCNYNPAGNSGGPAY